MEQAQCIRERVALECERAAALLGVELPPPVVKLDLSGATAGMFCRQGANEWLRFNPWLFAKEFDRHLHDTVIHEVCHYAIYRLLGGQRRIKPHGPEWQGLMTAMGAQPLATFTADLSDIPVRRQRRFHYQCACQTHEVSATRHHRIQRKRAEYRCRYCDSTLVPAQHM